LAAASDASASGLQIAPTSLEMASAGPAQALWLTNTGDHELRAQVRAYKWSQAQGKDSLEPTQALVASPPMLTVPPGGRQLVRVIRTGQDASSGEQTYRLLVDELPLESAKGTGVMYVLRYSVPVFAGVSGTPQLKWSGTPSHEGLELTVSNSGTAHAQIREVSLVGAGAATPIVPGLLGYVLPGATMHWTIALPAGANATNASLKALVNGNATDQMLSPGTQPR
ncbi:MAG TPA: molecular chaperone, partial [Rhodanobacteraceae bacterium]|nr:molecular chaperone [Rhodanobacteraceae bacterium]